MSTVDAGIAWRGARGIYLGEATWQKHPARARREQRDTHGQAPGQFGGAKNSPGRWRRVRLHLIDRLRWANPIYVISGLRKPELDFTPDLLFRMLSGRRMIIADPSNISTYAAYTKSKELAVLERTLKLRIE